jgi:hypothetical protein
MRLPSHSVCCAEILDDLAGTPLVLSVSYGGNEGSDVVSPGESLAEANFAMIATTNHTIVTASGERNLSHHITAASPTAAHNITSFAVVCGVQVTTV